jgi:ubiquitin
MNIRAVVVAEANSRSEKASGYKKALLFFALVENKMKHTFSCSNCEFPFSIFLTDETTRTSTSECEDVNTKSHNIRHEEECQNCNHKNTIYYGTDVHPLLSKSE